MSGAAGPAFGRRRNEPEPRQAAVPPAAAAPEPTALPLSVRMAELGALCLAQLDPAVVANMPAERLTPEVERLIGELATERRIQLNGREQRELAGELVHDMLGLGPLEPLLEDDSINDIMVDGPHRVFIERSGKLVLSSVCFRDAVHVVNICQRIAASIGRRVDESSPMVDARLKDGSRVNIVLRPLALDGPYIRYASSRAG